MLKPDPTAAERRHVFSLISELEGPLDQALALAGALDLMGFGLGSIADDHGPALLAVAHAITAQLRDAKTTWRQLFAAGSPEPRAKSHKASHRARRQ